MASRMIKICDYCEKEETVPPYPHSFGQMRIDFSRGGQSHVRLLDLCPGDLSHQIDMFLAAFGDEFGESLAKMSDACKADTVPAAIQPETPN